MNAFMRLLPGLIAAIVAFFALKLVVWLEILQTLGWQILLFFGVYLAAALVTDRAMRRYPAKDL